MKPNKVHVGNRIRNIRGNSTLEEFGIELGKKLDNTRIKEGIISRWENGVSIPNKMRLKAIAELGNISVNELLYGSHKLFVKEVISDELLKQDELYKVIAAYLFKVNKATERNIESEVLKFMNNNFNSLYDFLYTADLNNPEYNKAYDPTTIIETAINYFEYRLKAAEQSYKLNNDVDLHLLSPIKFKNLENKDDYEDKTKYEIDFSLSLTKTDWLSERPSRVELDYICYPTLEITLNHNKDTHYYYISGMSDFVDSHYERIYGEKTYKQLKDRLLEFALKKDYLKEYNIESFEELT